MDAGQAHLFELALPFDVEALDGGFGLHARNDMRHVNHVELGAAGGAHHGRDPLEGQIRPDPASGSDGRLGLAAIRDMGWWRLAQAMRKVGRGGAADRPDAVQPQVVQHKHGTQQHFLQLLEAGTDCSGRVHQCAGRPKRRFGDGTKARTWPMVDGCLVGLLLLLLSVAVVILMQRIGAADEAMRPQIAVGAQQQQILDKGRCNGR